MEIIGIDEEKIKAISNYKKEDSWISKYRLDSFKIFNSFAKICSVFNKVFQCLFLA